MQNQPILIISEAIREEILENLKSAKYYSIIVDCTPDISKVELMSVVVCFMQIKDGEELRIQEHFLDLLPIEQTSGEELTKAILQELRKYNIPLENKRGQAYDNASNVKGKCSGIQHKILCMNPTALFFFSM
jgi:anion-transporting  ArsA/GET3 family ATPase